MRFQRWAFVALVLALATSLDVALGQEPTESPTDIPTFGPSVTPTHKPSLSPTSNPTTVEPTFSPTTPSPTLLPSTAPTGKPTSSPTLPTFSPSFGPSETPSLSPTHAPTFPTILPTNSPSKSPSSTPTTSPTECPECICECEYGENSEDLNTSVFAASVMGSAVIGGLIFGVVGFSMGKRSTAKPHPAFQAVMEFSPKKDGNGLDSSHEKLVNLPLPDSNPELRNGRLKPKTHNSSNKSKSSNLSDAPINVSSAQQAPRPPSKSPMGLFMTNNKRQGLMSLNLADFWPTMKGKHPSNNSL